MSGKWLPMHMHGGEVSEWTGRRSVPPKIACRKNIPAFVADVRVVAEHNYNQKLNAHPSILTPKKSLKTIEAVCCVGVHFEL